MLKRSRRGALVALAVLMAVALAPVQAFAEQALIAAQGYTNAGYYDLNGTWQSRSDARQVSSSMHTLDSGWWVVDADKMFSQRLEIKGDTNLIVGNRQTLIVENGICINPGATLTIWTDTTNAEIAGKIIASSGSFSGIGSNPKTVGGTLIINGGNIKATGGYKSAGIGGSDEGRLTSVTINKGSVEAAGGQGGAGIGSGYKADSCPVTINGGEVKANGGENGAGIGGGLRVEQVGGFGGGCIINGGKVTATGGENGAGIGGGSGKFSSSNSIDKPYHGDMSGSGGVVINDGTVIATGGVGGAGIGGGKRGYAQGLTFNGGNVTAIAGELAAGIGGGAYGESTEITITGGTITAKACDGQRDSHERYYSGAAIGGGWRGDFGPANNVMLITGGKVKAIGAYGGAGIGAGSQGNMIGTLRITGGEVYAYGGRSGAEDVSADANRGGAGIGGGEEVIYDFGGECGTVIIEGGKVVACGGGGWHRAIGPGYNDSVMGSISIADHMYTRWTNTLTLGARNDDKTYNEPTVKESDLTASWADRRVWDCQNMRYVIIEPCPHNYSGATYIDTTVREHTLNSDCPYCKDGHAGGLSDHEFDPATHKCVCGHMERAVTFYNEDGSVYVPTDYYVEGTAINRPGSDPTREGFTFLGWFRKIGDNEYAPRPYNFSLPAGDSDISFYAKWQDNTPTPQTYEVTFHFTKHSSELPDMKAVDVVSGNPIAPNEIPSVPEASGEKFLGWFEQNADHAFDFGQPITGNVHLYDRWTSTYTVTFDYNDGSTPATTKAVDLGGTVSRPDPDPTRDGYAFAGWYVLDDEDSPYYYPNPYNFEDTVNSNFTLYALWEPESEDDDIVYVTFDANGGTLAAGTDVHVPLAKDQTVSEPANPTKDGAQFAGWKLNGNTYDWNTPVTESITLVAAWEEKGCTVSFDSAGGSSVASQTISPGSTVTKPTDPTREGYAFEGWFYDETDDIEPWDFENYQVLESLTLTAHWNSGKHVVAFDTQGGSAVAAQEVADGAKATRPAAPTRTGYAFAGWYLDGSSYGFDSPVKGDVTLTARWSKLCTVRFDPSGGTAVAPLQVAAGSKLAKPADPTRDGLEFLGWFVELEDGTNAEWIFEEYEVEDDLVLEAYWLADTHTVTFDTQGGSAVESQEVMDGSHLRKSEITEPTKAGSLFVGWFSDAGLTKPYDFSAPVKADVTIYAKWIASQNNKHTVVFDSDGGSYIAPQQLLETEPVQAPQNPMRNGFEFIGWYEVVDGVASGTPFEFGTPATRDTVLRAAWKALVEYEVSFDLDYEGGGSFAPESQSVSQGNCAQRPPEPIRDGYLFVGWYQTDENGTHFSSPYDFSTPVTKNMTLYAEWITRAENVAIVLFDSNGGGSVEPQVVEKGKAAEDPGAPEYEGRGFLGWYLEGEDGELAETPFDFKTPIDADTLLVALWELKTYDVSFDLGYAGAPTPPARLTVDHGATATQPSDPAREGYRFLGWFDGAKLYDFSAPVKGDLALRAKWQATAQPDKKGATAENLLKLKGTASKTSIKLSWNKVSGAKSYVVYGSKCSKTNYRKIKVLSASKGTVSLKKVAGKKLKRGTYYKFYVVAKSGKAGKGKALSKSKAAHVVTKGGRYGNFKKVTVLNVPGKKLTIKKGKSFKIRALPIPEGKGLVSPTHRKLAFESSNPKVAKVSASGKITAKAKGKANVYVYAQNGISAKIKVTVK